MANLTKANPRGQHQSPRQRLAVSHRGERGASAAPFGARQNDGAGSGDGSRQSDGKSERVKAWSFLGSERRERKKRDAAQKLGAGSGVGSASGLASGSAGDVELSPLAQERVNAGPERRNLSLGLGLGEGKPADLRRPGPFANSQAKTAAELAAAPSLSGRATQASDGSGVAAAGSRGPVLRLDEFEKPSTNWQKRRLDPVAPRVHPNPTPVSVAARRALARGEQVAESAGDKRAAKRARQKLAAQERQERRTRERKSGGILWYLIGTLILVALVLGALYAVYNEQAPAANANLTPAQTETQRILQVEQALQTLNFDPGVIDGQEDVQFRQALLLFQQFAGLPRDGRLTDEVIRELLATAEWMAPSQ